MEDRSSRGELGKEMRTEAGSEGGLVAALKTEEGPRKWGGGALEAGEGKEVDSPLEPPERTQLCNHLDLSPARAPLDFSSPEL